MMLPKPKTPVIRTSTKGKALILVGAAGLVILHRGALPASAAGFDTSLKPGAVPKGYVAAVVAAAQTCPQVTAGLLGAQLNQESGFDPHVVSPAGAQGIAQFMPGTWPNWAADDDGSGNVSPFNPYDAIRAMARYDCALAKTTAHVPGDPITNMLAAYNAGPDKVLAYHGVPPYDETRNYVASIKAAIPDFAGDGSAGSSGTAVQAAAAAPAAPAHHWYDPLVKAWNEAWAETAHSSGSSASATAPASDSGFAQREVQAAKHYLGTAYVWGGGDTSGPTNGGSGQTQGFDCSGLVLYAVYVASDGQITLPHYADDQAHLGTAVSRADLQPGDVIAFKLKGPDEYDHIVIYAGNGQVITAPQTGETVRMQSLASFGDVPMTIRRFG